MRYTYDVYEGSYADIPAAKRIDTTTNFEELEKFDPDNLFIIVTDNNTRKSVNVIEGPDDFYEWRNKLEKDHAWKPDKEYNTLKLERERDRILEDAIHSEIDAYGKVITAAEKDHINPKHYQNFVDEMQWIEVMQKIAHNKGQDFNIFIEYTIRKYLDRRGGKDPSLQEIRKAHWYLKLWEARIQVQGNPVMVNNIDNILENR